MRLTDLLAHNDFGLRLVTCDGEERTVTGAHSIDLADPGRWIAPGYLALTTGLAVRGSLKRQRAFVRSLVRARAAAVGFGIGVNFAAVPRGIVSEAKAAKLPVFEVPLATAFRDVIRFVLSANLNDDVRQLHRAISMQDYLLGALDESRPEQALVDRIREVLSARVVVMSSVGRIVAAAGNDPEALWERARRPRTERRRGGFNGSRPRSHPRRRAVSAHRRRAAGAAGGHITPAIGTLRGTGASADRPLA